MGWEGGKRGEVLDWRGCGAVAFCSEECVSTVCTGVSWRVEKEGGEIGIREQGPGNRKNLALGGRFCNVPVACQVELFG
jgi:hypothetical protein